MHSGHWRYARRFARSLSPRFRYGLFVIAGLALVGGLVHTGLTGSYAIAAAQSWFAADRGSGSASGVHGIRDQAPLVTAFAATLGSPTGVMRRVGASQEATWFTPAALIPAPFGPILISEGEVVEPHEDSTGKLAIAYLTGAGTQLRPRAIFIPAIESGSLGRIHDWHVRSDLGRYPVLQVEGEGDWTGHSCSWVTLLELQPERPVELATIAMSYDDENASTRIDGRIVPARSAAAIDVVYAGSANFTERYVRRGDRFDLDASAPTRMRTC